MNGRLISVYYYTDLIHVFRSALSNNFSGNHIYRLYLLGKDAPKEISIYSQTSASHYDLKSFNCLLYFMSISGIMQKIPECAKYFMSSHHIVVHILNLTYLLW